MRERKIDSAVKARWPLKPCEEPRALAIDRSHSRLLSACSNKLAAVVDAANGKVIATLQIGSGGHAAAFDPGTDLGFTSSREGTLTVMHEDAPDHFTVGEDVPTRCGARTMALDEKTHTLFLPTAQFGPRPAPTAEKPRSRPTILPKTFVVLVVSRWGSSGRIMRLEGISSVQAIGRH